MNKVDLKRPRFITFEGGEGAGKTTLMNYLQRELNALGVPLLRIREPGGTELGELIRKCVLTPGTLQIGDKAELLLFLAARAQHIEEVIKPALDNGQLVMCDRFNDSTIAYQGAARGLGVSFVKEMCLKTCDGVVPDLTLYLDVDPTIGLSRTRRAVKEQSASGNFDRIEAERLQFHLTVRQAFIDLSLDEPKRLHVLDANRPQAHVFAEAKKLLQHHLSIP